VLGCDFGIIFGQTEAGSVISMSSRLDSVEDRTQTCGHPLPGTEILLVDPSSTEPESNG